MAAKKHHTTQAGITAILVSALAGCTTPPSFIPEWTVTWTEWNWSRPGATQSQLNTEFAACEKQTAVAVASSVIPGSKAPGGTPAWRAALEGTDQVLRCLHACEGMAQGTGGADCALERRPRGRLRVDDLALTVRSPRLTAAARLSA